MQFRTRESRKSLTRGDQITKVSRSEAKLCLDRVKEMGEYLTASVRFADRAALYPYILSF